MSIIAALGVIAGLYYTFVPSDHEELGNLQDAKQGPFKDDYWPEHGYVDLSHGNTHYYLIGPKDGKKLVFVHGITSPPVTIAGFLDLLASKGYHLYGRGFSASPGTIYDEGLYVAQLSQLVLKMGWKNYDIVGYSMGGAIVAGFVSRFPEHVHAVGFIAPAGLMKKLPFAATFVKLPIFGKLLMHTFGRRILINMSKGNHIMGRENKHIAHFDDMQEYHIHHHPGMMRAYHSTVCHFHFNAFGPRFKQIQESHNSKVLAIWGQLDTVVPTELSLELRDLIPSMRLVIRKHVSHSIVMEDPEFVVQTLDQHFSGLL